MEEMKVIFRRLALLRTFFYYIEFKILKKGYRIISEEKTMWLFRK